MVSQIEKYGGKLGEVRIKRVHGPNLVFAHAAGSASRCEPRIALSLH